jgi:hypothetical protein
MLSFLKFFLGGAVGINAIKKGSFNVPPPPKKILKNLIRSSSPQKNFTKMDFLVSVLSLSLL